MPAHIVPIVEGHGEVQAVPILIRRIAEAVGIYDARVARPIRCPRQKLVKPSELERAIELAARKTGGRGQILVLIDSESDCPKHLAPALLARAQRARRDIPVAVVLAKREYEAWFLGAIESLDANCAAPPNPEEVQGGKERLQTLLQRRYSESIDQAAFTAVFALDRARERCDSFDKCWRAVNSLVTVDPPS